MVFPSQYSIALAGAGSLQTTMATDNTTSADGQPIEVEEITVTHTVTNDPTVPGVDTDVSVVLENREKISGAVADYICSELDVPADAIDATIEWESEWNSLP